MPKFIEKVDLRKYPETINNFLEQGEVVVTGDGHGNALRTFYTLIKEGVYHVSEQDYASFVVIYDKSPLTKDNLDAFDIILSNAKINPNALNGILDLTGDRIADRGANDIFELKIMAKLHEDEMLFRAPFSNHDHNFLEALYAYDPDMGYSPTLGFAYAGSMLRLGMLVNKGLVSHEEVKALVSIYISHLNLVSYDFAANGELIISSHAPIDLRVLKAMAEFEWDPANKDSGKIPWPKDDPVLGRPSNNDIADVIDKLNEKFRTKIASKEGLELLYPPNAPGWGSKNERKSIDEQVQLNPFYCALWNRNLDDLQIPEGIQNVHGHTGKMPDGKNRICVDSDLGKLPQFFESDYVTYHSPRKSLDLNLKKQVETKSASKTSTLSSPAVVMMQMANLHMKDKVKNTNNMNSEQSEIILSSTTSGKQMFLEISLPKSLVNDFENKLGNDLKAVFPQEHTFLKSQANFQFVKNQSFDNDNIIVRIPAHKATDGRLVADFVSEEVRNKFARFFAGTKNADAQGKRWDLCTAPKDRPESLFFGEKQLANLPNFELKIPVSETTLVAENHVVSMGSEEVNVPQDKYVPAKQNSPMVTQALPEKNESASLILQKVSEGQKNYLSITLPESAVPDFLTQMDKSLKTTFPADHPYFQNEPCFQPVKNQAFYSKVVIYRIPAHVAPDGRLVADFPDTTSRDKFADLFRDTTNLDAANQMRPLTQVYNNRGESLYFGDKQLAQKSGFKMTIPVADTALGKSLSANKINKI